jgi:hypothetical protein
MRVKPIIISSVTAFCLALACPRVGATQFLSNLSYTPSSPLFYADTLGPGGSTSASFSTGSGASYYDLNFVTLQLDSPVQFATNLTVELYEVVDSQLVIAGQLGKPVLDSRPTGFFYAQFVDFSPFSTLQLQPLTEYVLKVGMGRNTDDMNSVQLNQYDNYTTPTDWIMYGDLPYEGELTLAVDATAVVSERQPSWVLFGCSAMILGLARKFTGGIAART